MKTKMFEVRDRATFIAVVATKLESNHPAERRLLERGGFDGDFSYILLTELEYHKSTYDPYKWDNRSLRVAHQFIAQNFDELETGAVVDVEVILGEKAITASV